MIGQSHSLALLEGASSLGTDLPDGLEISFVADWRGTLLRAKVSSAACERSEPTTDLRCLSEAAAAAYVFLLWWGNQVNLRALLQVGPPFDVVLPTDTEAPEPEAELVPCSAVEAYVRKSLAGDGVLPDVLAQAHEHGSSVCFLAPPPPLPSEAVRDRLAQSPHWMPVLDELGLRAADAEIVADRVRVRLRALLLEEYESFASDHGASFLLPPQEATDDAGLLREEFWSTDVSHANPLYGVLYLRQLLDWVREADRG